MILLLHQHAPLLSAYIHKLVWGHRTKISIQNVWWFSSTQIYTVDALFRSFLPSTDYHKNPLTYLRLLWLRWGVHRLMDLYRLIYLPFFSRLETTWISGRFSHLLVRTEGRTDLGVRPYFSLGFTLNNVYNVATKKYTRLMDRKKVEKSPKMKWRKVQRMRLSIPRMDKSQWRKKGRKWRKVERKIQKWRKSGEKSNAHA